MLDEVVRAGPPVALAYRYGIAPEQMQITKEPLLCGYKRCYNFVIRNATGLEPAEPSTNNC
jgi:hypothetical protein